MRLLLFLSFILLAVLLNTTITNLKAMEKRFDDEKFIDLDLKTPSIITKNKKPLKEEFHEFLYSLLHKKDTNFFIKWLIRKYLFTNDENDYNFHEAYNASFDHSIEIETLNYDNPDLF